MLHHIETVLKSQSHVAMAVIDPAAMLIVPEATDMGPMTVMAEDNASRGP